ncbi:MAG: WYL domain-containing protein [Candidatus Dormibacteraeota bacterium]|nr:WYL domain-containing protein [Candidatus Dormibacteraeota bacterium]
MRSERLLQLLLLLQARGRLTARDLAARFDVSTRTIQRDMDVLSVAGVPVRSVRGGQGGWELAEGFRTALTGITAAEALAVVVGRPPAILADLGLDEGASEGAVAKLLAAMPGPAREGAEHALERIHIDLTAWTPAAAPTPLPLLRQAVSEDRVVRFRYAHGERELRVAPLGLVAKGLAWYLVGLRDGALRTYRVQRMREVALTDQGFERPAGFDLAGHWREAAALFVSSFPQYLVRIRTRGAGLRRLSWAAGATVRSVGPVGEDGWAEAQVDCENRHEALSWILAFGGDVAVEEPAELREAVREAARSIAELNAPAEERARAAAGVAEYTE